MGSPHDSDIPETLRSPPPSARILIDGFARVIAVLFGLIIAGELIDLVLRLRPFSPDPWRWLGLAPLFLGTVLEVTATRAFWSLGKGTPHPSQPPRRLVDGGPYAHSRNPLYMARLLVLFGAACFVGSVSTLVITLVLFLSLDFFLIPREEARLRARLGRDYDEYCARVARWFSLRHTRLTAKPR